MSTGLTWPLVSEMGQHQFNARLDPECDAKQPLPGLERLGQIAKDGMMAGAHEALPKLVAFHEIEAARVINMYICEDESARLLGRRNVVEDARHQEVGGACPVRQRAPTKRG